MENQPKKIAKQLTDAYFGGNWTSVNVQDALADVTWQESISKVHNFNSIATLTHHTHYYVVALIDVLEGRPLTAKDAHSFDHPPIANENDWKGMRENIYTDVRHLATLIEQLPSAQLDSIFVDSKYGTYYRNLHGLIEHLHYHLGQMTLIKKLLRK
jgi:hypothetical protein